MSSLRTGWEKKNLSKILFSDLFLKCLIVYKTFSVDFGIFNEKTTFEEFEEIYEHIRKE